MNRECPVDIGLLAESYHLGLLSPEQAAALEEHYLGCPRCTAEIERAETYVRAMRAAGRRIRTQERRDFTTAHSA